MRRHGSDTEGDPRQARFWNRHAARYARRPVSDQAAYARKLEITRSYLRPEMEVVEFGCGTGSTALEHAPHVRHILGVDLSTEMLRIAAEKAETAGVTNIDFRRGTIESHGVPDASADMVLMLSLLHLLDDPAAAVAKAHRMLRPDGLLVISTPCLSDMVPWMRPLAMLGRAVGLLPRLSFFTHTQLTAMLKDSEFTVEHDWQPKPKTAVFIVARMGA